MIIRVKKTWKDFIEGDPNHKRLVTRRDFMERGLLTGAMSMTVPSMLVNGLAKNAMADASICPQPVRNGGALAQYYMDGGSSVFAYILDNITADIASNSTTAANNYGIVQADLVQVGTNMVVSRSHPFGQVLLLGAPGYTQADWQNRVLRNCSFGRIVGPLNQDDGGMPDNLKTGAGLGKTSLTKDIRVGNNTPISWALGVPSSSVNNLTVANLARTFGITPAGNTNAATMTNSANAAQALSTLFGGMFALNGRKGAANITTNANCGFFGDAALTDPTYGTTLFDPAQITALQTKTAGLSATELAMLSAFYRSATGDAGAVVIDRGGYDYHGQNGATVGAKGVEAARALVMFLAACDSAGQKGAFAIASNGSAIASGIQANTNLNVGGNSTSANAANTITSNPTNPQGDSGGFFNECGVVFYSPTGTPPATKNVGSINTGTGSATSDPGVTSVLNAISGLYLSSALWLGNATVNYAKLSSAIGKVGGDITSGKNKLI